MEKDTIGTFLIDPKIENYSAFFDHAWCENIFKVVKLTNIEEPINKLMLAWREINGAHILPWLMVHSLKRFAQGEGSGSLRFQESYSTALVAGLSARLGSRMRPSLTQVQQETLKGAIDEIEVEVSEKHAKSIESADFPIDEYWNFLLQKSEFHFSIVGIQRINYGALFFAYEYFLANVIRTKDPGFNSKKTQIKDGFDKQFGVPLREFCWTDTDIELPKLVRHALAHNGGRFGTDLEKFKAQFVDATGVNTPALRGDRLSYVNDQIQITPRNVRYLFGILKDRVSRIVKEFV